MKPTPDPNQWPNQWQENKIYLHGVDLFNTGLWWEAHEAWETLWLKTDKASPLGLFLIGLIQYSASLLKWKQEKPKSALKLGNSSIEKLTRVEAIFPDFCGLNLREWLKQARTFVKKMDENALQKDPLQHIDFPHLFLNSRKKLPPTPAPY